MSKRKISLANKYRPATFSDMSEQASIKTILENQIKNNKLKGAYLFTGSAGVGKAQPLDADIMTINGYKKMKDVQLNDILIDGLGNSCKVIGIYPQSIKPVYKITFSDRTSTLCSDEHIWKVGHYVNSKNGVKWENLTIKELLNINLKKGNNTKGWKYRIPTPIINCWSDSNLKIDPYLLGCLLGDGCLTEHTINISNPEEDIINKLNKLAEDINYKLSLVNQSKKNRCPMYNFVKQENCNFGLRDYIKSLNLNKSCLEKHIPKEYLYTTVENRIKLLQGLFDTDGWVCNRNDNRSVLIFNTSSPQLSEDFAFLVRSLGGTDTVVRKEAKYCLKGSKEYKRCNDTYQHIIKFSNDILPFSSEKHKAKYKSPQNKAMRRIVNIEHIGEQECQCIKVDSIDETYMTNDLIVTHNTTSARIIAGMMNEHKGRPIEMDCASHNGIEDMRKIIDDCRSRPIGTKYKIFILDECHMLTIQSWNGLLKLLEEPPEYVILLLCTTNPEKIPGTILSRVQRFNLARISTQGIINRLKHIIDSENKDFMQSQDLSESEIQLRNQLIQENKPYIQYEDSAISYIARLAKGGMRDSITNLEKCLDYSRDLTLDNVHTILSGGVNEQTLLEFLKYTLNKDSKGCLLHFNNIYMSGVDTLLFLKLYIEFLENCIKYIITQDANIVTLADDTLSWVFQNRNFIQEMRYQLLDALKIRNDYSSEDLKIVIESWIIQICNS